jgi:hypothetical protein
MAVVNTKSTIISNADATPRIVNTSFLDSGEVRSSAGFVSVAAGDDDGSVYRLFRVPSGAILLGVEFKHAAIAGATDYDLNFYDIQGTNLGAIISPTPHAADAIDFSLARAQFTNLLFGGATGIAASQANKRCWELTTLAVDPKKPFDVCLLANVVGTAAGDIAFRAFWTV